MRARYYSTYLKRFLRQDPIGFNGGSNWYSFAGGDPIGKNDPFGLYETFGQYMGEVGQVYQGYGDAIAGTIGGLAYAVTSPIQTVKGVAQAVSHPVNMYNAVATVTSDTWESGLRGQGRVMGEVFLAVALAGAGKAVATAGKAEDIVQVSRWGRAGLIADDFVQLGGVTRPNFAATGKWSSLGGNQVADFASGVAHNVPSSSLHWPTGIDAVKGVLGQRIYNPSSAAMSYGSAAAIGTGIGAATYGAGKAGEASLFGLGQGWGLGSSRK